MRNDVIGSTWRGMGRYRFPVPSPLPPNEEALREAAVIDAEIESLGERLGVAPSNAWDEAWRIQRRHGPIERISACHRLANAYASAYRARELAQGGRSSETMAFRLKEARRLADEARVAIVKAKEWR